MFYYILFRFIVHFLSSSSGVLGGLCFTVVAFRIFIMWVIFKCTSAAKFTLKLGYYNIGIKHCFSCINVCQVQREVLKTEAFGLGFQHLPRDLAIVNVLENNV